MSKQSQTGFTLVEVMVVVGILGILAAIGVPAYQNYVVRAQVSEGIVLAGGWKTAVLDYYANNGTWPAQADLTGSASSVGKYISGISVDSGVIQITYGGPQAHPAIQGAVLTLVPYTNANNDVVWQCGLAPKPAGNIAVGAAPGGTTLAAAQLPAQCTA